MQMMNKLAENPMMENMKMKIPVTSFLGVSGHSRVLLKQIW